MRPVLIIIAAGTLALVAACSSEFVPDASEPKAAVRTFLGYLARGDGEGAYALLTKSAREQCNKDFFLDSIPILEDELDRSRVIVRDTTVRDSRASVRATVDPGRVDVGVLGPRGSSFETTYSLELEEGEWRVGEGSWPYGYCDFSKRLIDGQQPPATAAPAVPEATPVGTPAGAK